MKPDREQQFISARLRLNVVEWGPIDAPPLFLQHGGRDHCRSWDGVAQAFAKDFRVIAPDLRGHGNSQWASDGDYTIMDFVYDVKTLFDVLRLPPCHVIGHSLGGNIVTRFAGLYPDRVIKLVNIEGLGFPSQDTAEDQPKAHLEQLREWMPRHDETSHREARRFPDLAAAIARMMQTNQRLSKRLAHHLAVTGTNVHADGSLSFKYDPGISGRTPLDLPLPVRHALWREVTCPLLAIYGAESWAGNPKDDGRLGYFRDARLITFERAGHWVQHDRRTDFIAAIWRFFSE